MKLENDLKLLDYKIINISSIEQYNQINIIPYQKLPKLLRINGPPWISERFCQFPQKIIIKFPHLVYLYQINILSNSKKISRRLQFYSYYPDELDSDINYKEKDIPFTRIGFVNLRDNKANNYSVRELKKIFIKTKCLYLKIELEKNYINEFNKFQQVGLSTIECFGDYLDNNIKILPKKNNEKEKINSNAEKILKEICPDTKENLNKFVNNKKNLEYEDYDEIKGRLDEIMKEAKKIYKIMVLEKEASKDNDFDKAIEFKNKKEKAKYILKNKASEINKLYKNEFNTNNLPNGSDIKSSINSNEKNKFNYEKENSLLNSNQFVEEDINNKSLKKNYSAPEINIGNESNYLSKINNNKSNNNINNNNNNNSINNIKNNNQPVEEIDPKYLKNFQSLIPFITINGLSNLLSSKIGNKLEGFKLLNSKFDQIFNETNGNIIQNIYELIELIGIILEDKNTLFLKQVSDLIEGVIDRISNNENMMNDNKLKNLINKNIMDKIKENIGVGSELKKLGKLDKATELYLFILDKDIFNLDILIKSLLTDDINLLNSSENLNSNIVQNNKIYSKLNILKRILEDFDNKIDNKITSKESFPKELVTEYILLNIKNKDIKIRKLLDELLKMYIEIFGLDELKRNALYYFNDETEFKKLSNLVPSLKPLFKQLLKNSEEINLFIPSQKPKQYNKLKSIQNSFEIKNKKNSPKKEKEKENICELCKNKIGSKTIEEHICECKMYTICEGCGENIKVEKLNNHKLNFCKNKKKYKQCNKCKEAILSDLYNLHIEKNVCNPIKTDMSRCPFCHHDIEKDQNGFYQHLIVDGCAYQT